LKINYAKREYFMSNPGGGWVAGREIEREVPSN
jgi:hypothetical protein